jgi:hypothetical protein
VGSNPAGRATLLFDAISLEKITGLNDLHGVAKASSGMLLGISQIP